MQSCKTKKKGGNSNIRLQCNLAKQKREVTPNIIDCNAIGQNLKKGGNSNLIDYNAIVKKKGGNSNLIDCNAITQNIKGK